MRLQSVHNARSVWWGHLSDLNPSGINLLPVIVPLLIDNYKFIQFPSKQDTNLADGLKFQKGEFTVDGGYPALINFTLYDGGFIADSGSSTDHADAFLKDILNKYDEIFQRSNSEQVIYRKIYLSELYVTTDNPIERLNPHLEIISEYLSNNVVQGNRFEAGGISFFPDQAAGAESVPVFRFERAVNIPLVENRYYSIAPLQTHKHIELLNKLEEVLSFR